MSRRGRRAGAGAGSTVVAFPGRSARERRRRLVGLLAAVFAALALAAWAVFASPLLAVDRIEVTGTRLVDRAAVEERVAPLRGVPLPRIGSSSAGDLLSGMPGVASARTVAVPPTALEVRVEELAPVARSAGGDRAQVLLEDGSVLGSVPVSALPGEGEEGRALPSAPEALLTAGPDVRASAATVLRALPDGVRDRVRGVDAGSPEQVRLDLGGGRTLVWGDASEPERKAAVAQALLDGLEDARGVREVDVSVPDRPVTR